MEVLDDLYAFQDLNNMFGNVMKGQRMGELELLLSCAGCGGI